MDIQATEAVVTTYWLSFCDASRPRGEQFLGACIVDAASPKDAFDETVRCGINPGGEALIVPAPEGQVVDRRWKGRLLSRADVADYDAALGAPEDKRARLVSERSAEEQADIASVASRVCGRHVPRHKA